MYRRKTWWLGLVSSLVLTVAGMGCGQGSSTGEIFGTVSFQGKPLRSGTVTFLGAGGEKKYARISTEGTYRVAEVPLGKAQVAVLSHAANPFSSDPANKPVEISPRYSKPETSGITLHVKAGRQPFNIAMK
jgi:hypothetical protein